jgi:hypothetical protein
MQFFYFIKKIYDYPQREARRRTGGLLTTLNGHFQQEMSWDRNNIALEFAIIASQRIIGGIIILYRFGHYVDSPREKGYRGTKNPLAGEHRLL